MRNKPLKHLGQNFLTSKKIIEDIIRAADLSPDDVVLEVGPGKGILTEELLKKAGRVIAVEKDKRLAEFLREKFKSAPNLELVEGDILKFDANKLKANETKSYKIVANIPYYITSRFLRKFLESDYQPSRMVLMVQKEVAERIIGERRKGCKESILSISVKAYGEPKIIKKVPAEFFSPKPKVDSAILLIDNISKDFFRELLGRLENDFFNLIRKGFAHKRKFLIKNLSDCSNCSKPSFEQWQGVFEKCKIPQNARAEDLKLEDWRCFVKGLHFFEHLV